MKAVVAEQLRADRGCCERVSGSRLQDTEKAIADKRTLLYIQRKLDVNEDSTLSKTLHNYRPTVIASQPQTLPST